jgi:hypothetical protein
MKYTNLILAVMVVIAGLFVASCSKDNSVAPAAADEQVTTVDEVAMKQPSPGTYKIQKFIDTGDDETAQFNGYKFQFKADGALVVTTGSGQTFTGSWDLNSAETVMTLNIAGNAALDDLDDDDWQVLTITNRQIKITANGPDTVTFVKIAQ